MTALPRKLSFLLVAAAMISATSCPSTQPTRPLDGSGKPTPETKVAQPEFPPDDPEAVAALEKAAYLTKNNAGRVTKVELKPSATDEALKHLASLPGVERLEANVRGASDEGLTHL